MFSSLTRVACQSNVLPLINSLGCSEIKILSFISSAMLTIIAELTSQKKTFFKDKNDEDDTPRARGGAV